VSAETVMKSPEFKKSLGGHDPQFKRLAR